MSENKSSEEAQFNQASFQQQRINELLLRVDRLSINPLEFNQTFNSRNYEIIFNDLCSVLLTISAKLTLKEKKDAFKDKVYLRSKISKYPVFINIKNGLICRRLIWEAFETLLFDFRVKIEMLIDKHGFGNPSKPDRSKIFSGGGE